MQEGASFTRGGCGVGEQVELRQELEQLRIEVREAKVVAQTVRNKRNRLRRSRQRL